MPFIKIWIHLVWATKKRARLLTKDMRQQVFKHIRDYGLSKGIHVGFVNGHIDHVHCLILLNADQTIANMLQLLRAKALSGLIKIICVKNILNGRMNILLYQ